MNMQFGMPLQIQEFKAAGDEWLVEGYASTFGTVDLGYDVVMPGAFDKTLASGQRVGFFHSHDPRLVLGVTKKLKTDKRGLFGSFKISKTTLGQDTRQLLLDDAMGGFSIGYWPKEAEFVENGKVRQLHEIELVEISVVSMPMNPDAVITGVKDYYSLLGIDSQMTIAEKARAFSEGLSQLLSDTTAVIGSAERPLTQTKRQELTDLLEMFSGLDAVRSDLQSVLAAAPIVGSKRALYELRERRQRLSRVLME